MFNKNIRCCAFTCSSGRPLFLRNCIFQMKSQTHLIDHYIYASNTPKSIISDVATNVEFGPNLDQHSNHIKALSMIDIEKYDLFFKIDDDDIYKPKYVNNSIESYCQDKWEYSGGHSNGILLGNSYKKGLLTSLCIDPTVEEIKNKVVFYMPSTLALTKKAVRKILELKEVDYYEDITWRNVLWNSGFKFRLRDTTQDYTYVVHGENISTAGWLNGGNKFRY